MCGPTTSAAAAAAAATKGDDNKHRLGVNDEEQPGVVKAEDPTNTEMEEEAVKDGEEETEDDVDDDNKSSCCCSLQCVMDFYWKYEFLILIVIAILLAKAYPPLGAVYLAPQITATWIAVMFIFLMAGLGLKTSEFKNAFQQLYFNVYVQVYNFGVDSAFVFGLSRFLSVFNIISKDLADGMTIAACLPMTINMCVVLTKSSGGDEAAAVFNAAFGNLVGVFLSPLLILGYLGVTGDVDIVQVFYKLAIRVVLPIVVGQILQKTSKRVMDFVTKYKKYFKQAQQYTLVFIVYTVFCRTFYDNSNQSNIGDILIMIAFVFISLTCLMVLSWYSLKLLFPNKPTLRVMGLFGCTHKTVAMGIPLINAIYENNPAVGLYTLPLLIWHPMQLVIGTLLAPRLATFVNNEKERLGIVDDDGQEFDRRLPSVTQQQQQQPGSVESLSSVAAEEGKTMAKSSKDGGGMVQTNNPAPDGNDDDLIDC